MLRPHVRRAAVLAGAAMLVCVTAAWSGPAHAEGTAPTTPAPTYTNGMLAYTCFGHASVTGQDGWVTRLSTATPIFVQWRAGKFASGVQWSADGSEMVHVAAMTLSGPPTIVVSEADRSYPWQDTNFAQATGWTDSDATFSADGTQIFFTRRQAGHSTIEVIPAAGSDSPTAVNQPPGDNSQPTASVSGDLAYTNVANTPGAQPFVWIVREGTTTPVQLVAGSMPRFSPDGTKIALLAGNRIKTINVDGTGQVTTGPALTGAIDDFRWSPDGTKYVLAAGGLALTAPTAKDSTAVAFGGSECAQGVTEVGWQPLPALSTRDKVYRVYGDTREGTAIAISQTLFANLAGGGTLANAVVLADSRQFPDGLSAAALAAKVHGPLLLTPSTLTTLLPVVSDEITRLIGSTGNVYIVGGTGSVSQRIQTDLEAAGYTVTRVFGSNRYETSLAVAKFLGEGANAPRQLLLATGTDFPDGLSAGAAAASYWVGSGPQGGAVLLTNGSTLTPDVRAYIEADIAAHPAQKVTITTVGGLADKAYPVAGRISCVGADRYATSACIARMHFGAQPSVAIATGLYFPDALAGGVLAGAVNAPLLLAPKPLTTATAVPYWLNVTSGATHVAYAFGGPGVLGGQVNQLKFIIGEDTGFITIMPK